MFQFVNWLRLFAVLFITNSHYGEIWPVSAMAVGGHLGNCLYFLLSGFCLYNIKESFSKWYGKRILRIYPSLWIAIIISFIFGDYAVNSLIAVFRCFIYPTWHHFIASIMLLYIFLYIVRWMQKKWKWLSTPLIMLAVFAVFLVLYVFRFDKSYYHIDSVAETWVRFQFAESMLVGMLLREHYEKINRKISVWNVAAVIILAFFHLAGKLILRRYAWASLVQCLNPMFTVLFVVSIAVLFIKMEKNGIFAKVPGKVNSLVVFMSGLTLDIYLAQMLIIGKLQHLAFPLDFFLVTGLILLYAWALNKCSAFIQGKCKKLLHL